MRWKFWQQPDFYEEIPRAKRPRETLTQLSEKLIMKQMKQDAEYGLQMAEKVKKVAKVENKTLLSQVKELRQIQTALRELGVGGEEQGSSILMQILQALPMVPQLLDQLRQSQAQQSQVQQPPQPEQLSQPEQPQLTQPTEEIPMPSLGELLPYLEEEPESVISMLKERQEAGDQQAILWLNLLSKSSYRQICSLLRPVQEKSPELETLIGSLLHESREKWWRELLDGAKRAV